MTNGLQIEAVNKDQIGWHIVSGAPGSGKSTILDAFLRRKASGVVAFDMDWLIDSASRLAGSDLRFDEVKWDAYNVIWFDVLSAVSRNNCLPLLFSPIAPSDLAGNGQLANVGIRWLLLDCPDEVRRNRLTKRNGWNEARIQEAAIDAAQLRQEIAKPTIDTHVNSPTETAKKLADWLPAKTT